MVENKLFTMLEALRGDIAEEKYIELIAVGGLIGHLSKDDQYNENVNIEKIVRAESNARDVLYEMFETIEREIPSLKDVFVAFTAFKQLESSHIIHFFYDVNEILQDKTADYLIKTYIKHMPINVAFATPDSINTLAAMLLQPKGTFYDGTIHYAGGALAMYKDTQQRNESLHIAGQEISTVSWAVAKIRLFIAGVKNADIALGNVLTEPAHTLGDEMQKFDTVYMAPPFRMRLHEADTLKIDTYNRFLYGIPPKTSADYAFISHALASLNETGRGIVLVADGSLFRGGAEGKIRHNMIASDVIEAIISLPGGIFQHTNISVNLIIFNKNKRADKQHKIQYIKVTDENIEKKRHMKKIPTNTIEKIVKTIEEFTEEAEFSRILTVDALEDDNLLPERYIYPTTMELEEFGEVIFDLEALQAQKTIKLSDDAIFYRGFNVGSKHEETPDGAYKIIRLSDVQDGKLLLDQVPHFNIESNARIDMYRVQKGDVIVSIRGGIIKTAIIEVEIDNLLLSQNFIGVRCQSLIDPYYLKTYIESPVGQYLLLNRMSGTTILTLGRKDLEELEVPYKPIDEQRAMTEKYFKCECAIEAEIKALEQTLQDKKVELYQNMGLKNIFTM